MSLPEEQGVELVPPWELELPDYVDRHKSRMRHLLSHHPTRLPEKRSKVGPST